MNAQVAVFGFTVSPVSYTYTIPPGLKVLVGQLVEVPFGRRLRQGIVTEVGDFTPADTILKPISRLVTLKPLLSEKQLSLAGFISSRYFASLAESIELMLPRVPKMTPERPGQEKQELLLFPTLRQAAHAQRKEGGLLFSHTLKPQDFDRAWQAISSGKARRILGPRTALFAPFRNLKRLCIFQTESDVYKEERRPYYRALPVAEELTRIFGAKLEAVSYSPRVQDEFLVPHTIKILPSQEIRLTDLRHQPILNSDLKKALTEAAGKRILIFLNRRSEKGPLQCRTCKEVTYTADASVCPNCGGADVRFQTFNLQTLAKKIESPANSNVTFATQQILFEDTAPFDLVAILSADTFLHQPSYNSTEKTFQLVTSLRRLLKPRGKMIIQTGFPEEPAIKLSLAGSYRDFYLGELKVRKDSNNPPFTKIARITSTKENEPPALPGLDVFGPFQGKKTYFVVRGQDLSALKDLPRSWKLDIDPLSL